MDRAALIVGVSRIVGGALAEHLAGRGWKDKCQQASFPTAPPLAPNTECYYQTLLFNGRWQGLSLSTPC